MEQNGSTREKRIALVGYAPAYFQRFAHALEACGFRVHWICSATSEARELTRGFGWAEDCVLDTTSGFDPKRYPDNECRRRLAGLERPDGPRIHDVILMDRILRTKPDATALAYLCHAQQALTRFLSERRITLVTSGRDTATQLLSMLVSRTLSIPWVVPNRLRIPSDMYGFCRVHETTDMVVFRATTDADRIWADEVLAQFEMRAIAPALKKAARGFSDVVKMLPEHARVFGQALRRAVWDRGNDYTRYTVPQLIRMYARRRWNMIAFKLSPPAAPLAHRPFCLYALHTQPESSIDVAGAYFSDQVALITFISRSLPVTHELWVKIHPTDVDGKPHAFYRRIAEIPGVRLIGHEHDSRNLVHRASLVFALTGTIAYEAALLGKPVIIFADNYFNGLPTIDRCEAPPQLPRLIDRKIDAGPPPDLRARTIEFLADLRSRCFPGEVNRMYGERARDLSNDDLTSLQSAYLAVHETLAGRHATAQAKNG